MKMMATYNRQKKLNVRKEPSPSAEIVGEMHPGESRVAEVVDDGWCQVEGGFVRADLVTVRLDGEQEDGAAEGDALSAEQAGEGAPSAEQVPAVEPADVEQPQPDPVEPMEAAQPALAEPAQPGDDDAGELRNMTIPNLRKLAEQSGIKIATSVKKKDDIIAAILAADD